MDNLTFDGMPQSLALLHDKADSIISMLSVIANDKAIGNRHIPIGMTEASKLLGKSPSTIYDMTSKRKIPFHKRGNRLYFFEDELLKWIENGGCSDVDYPEGKGYGTSTHTAKLKADSRTSIDDLKAEQHLKTLQSAIKHKPKSGM